MNAGFDFRQRLPENLPDAWRALDRSVARWVLAHGGDAMLARLAGWASFSDGQGDGALMLDAMHAARLGIDDSAALLGAVTALVDDSENRWVATSDMAQAQANAPFVLDGEAFYLRRNFLDEIAVAQALRARLDAELHAGTLDDAALDLLFQHRAAPEEIPQRNAVRAALGRRLFVLTGGPGSGKTTTVLRLLMAQIATFSADHGHAPVVRLAAPTGKAAQRLAQSLREGAARFDALPDDWQAALDHALAAETGTLHRLLGERMHGQRDGQRLPADIVLVDEASMIDLGLLRRLLDALRDDATLVLVGDADQLAPVGIGTALADLVSALDGDAALARLQHSFRSDRMLVAINEAVRRGDDAGFADAFAAAAERATHHRLPDVHALTRRLTRWSTTLGDVLQHAGAFQAHAESDVPALQQALDVTSRQQLLCALRDGVFGAIEANIRIERQLHRHPALAGWAERLWYPGRLVIVARNDYSAGLFNGDVGICLRLIDAQGRERLAVVFPAAPDGDGLPRCFDPDSLPAHEPAFALTVHKSQGSEYQRVAVLLPPLEAHPLLARQMLYTALSRARDAVELWAEPAAITACLRTTLGRMGKLARRLSASTGG